MVIETIIDWGIYGYYAQIAIAFRPLIVVKIRE
jgi:hypothetical protein